MLCALLLFAAFISATADTWQEPAPTKFVKKDFATDSWHTKYWTTSLQHYRYMEPKQPLAAGRRRLSEGTETEDQWQPIRIGWNTDVLTEDDSSKTCYNRDAAFRRGEPESIDAVCSDTVTENCWDTCTEAMILSESSQDFIITTLLPRVGALVTAALSVEPLDGPLVLTGNACGDDIR